MGRSGQKCILFLELDSIDLPSTEWRFVRWGNTILCLDRFTMVDALVFLFLARMFNFLKYVVL